MLLIRFFAFLTCQTGEAQEPLNAVSIEVSASHGAKAAAALFQDMPADQSETPSEPKVVAWPKPMWGKEPKPKEEPDVHAEALGIDGTDIPAFVSSPQTPHEAVAAEFYKADATKKQRRARKRTEAHKSSVVQWFKERCFAAPGRVTWSTQARPDYESWCAGLNLEPVNPKLFGMTLRSECGVLAEPKSKGTKYFDIGLRAGGLRVVSG
jgi:hypothetical protein